MRHQLLAGETEQLNRLNARPGEMAVDTEKKALRTYDGELQGGFEALGVRAYEPPPYSGPGPQELMAGDLTTGFYGEVSPADFISYGDLCTLVGVSAGTLHNQGQRWLKFSMDGTPAYVSKRTIRHNLSWTHLSARSVVRGRTVGIGDRQYTVRLLTGLVRPNTFTAGGEWNRLLYPIASSTDSLGWGVNIRDADLGIVSGYGTRSWCQETTPGNSTQRVTRGGGTMTNLLSSSSSGSGSSTAIGWRPILIPLV